MGPKIHATKPVVAAMMPWPDIEANPALQDATGDQAAHTGGPDQDVTHKTGPGTGGATETADRAPAIEGAKRGTKPKG